MRLNAIAAQRGRKGDDDQPDGMWRSRPGHPGCSQDAEQRERQGEKGVRELDQVDVPDEKRLAGERLGFARGRACPDAKGVAGAEGSRSLIARASDRLTACRHPPSLSHISSTLSSSPHPW